MTHEFTPAIGQQVASSDITLTISKVSRIEESKYDFKAMQGYSVKIDLQDKTKHEKLGAGLMDDGLDTAAGGRREQLAVLAVLSQDISSAS